MPSGRCIVEVVAQLNLALGWDRRDEILRLGKPFEDALRAYAHTAFSTA